MFEIKRIRCEGTRETLLVVRMKTLEQARYGVVMSAAYAC